MVNSSTDNRGESETNNFKLHQSSFFPISFLPLYTFSLFPGVRCKLGRTLKMAAVWRAKVPPNSATLEEARKRMFDFFKTACRSLPAVMDIYNLHDIATISQLRSSIAAQIRKNADVRDPKVIDMLIFKGTEELENIVEHSKQRHHIIGQYVVGPQGLVQDTGSKEQGLSPFLKNFYKSNYV